jgi:hypothetical protein
VGISPLKGHPETDVVDAVVCQVGRHRIGDGVSVARHDHRSAMIALVDVVHPVQQHDPAVLVVDPVALGMETAHATGRRCGGRLCADDQHAGDHRRDGDDQRQDKTKGTHETPAKPQNSKLGQSTHNWRKAIRIVRRPSGITNIWRAACL